MTKRKKSLYRLVGGVPLLLAILNGVAFADTADAGDTAWILTSSALVLSFS